MSVTTISITNNVILSIEDYNNLRDRAQTAEKLIADTIKLTKDDKGAPQFSITIKPFMEAMGITMPEGYKPRYHHADWIYTSDIAPWEKDPAFDIT